MAIHLTIVSGIGPSNTGTGALIEGLIKEAKLAKKNNVEFLFRVKTPRLRGWLKLHRFNPFRIIYYLLNRILFPIRAMRAAQASHELVLLHPQTIGFSLFNRIIESRECTWMYVLDAFLFCRRSYNYIPGESKPCLRCLGNDGAAASDYDCVDQFRSGPFKEHIPRLVRSGKLRLMAQCNSHARLLRAHFGANAVIKVVPLFVPDLEILSQQHSRLKNTRPLVVFHGTCQPAKGITHVIALARLMPDWDFLVPSSPREYLNYYDTLEGLPNNLIFRQMNWSSGLSKCIVDADFVICPSMWTATVEGAILKSLAHNGMVILYPSQDSFASEVPASARIEFNPSNLSQTAAQMYAIFQNPSLAEIQRMAARDYITGYLNRSRGMLSHIIDILSD